jgi:hypothetical protein
MNPLNWICRQATNGEDAMSCRKPNPVPEQSLILCFHLAIGWMFVRRD